ASREIGERGRDRLHIFLDQFERGADLHDRRRVGDILRSGAPMAPSPEPVAAQTDDLLHHAEDRIADPFGLLLQPSEVDVLDPALTLDLACVLFRDDAETALRPGERDLDLQIIAGSPFVGENLPHCRRGEDVTEDRGIDFSLRHVAPLAQATLRESARPSRCVSTSSTCMTSAYL